MLSPVEEIKSRIDIVELVGSYVRLQRGGMNFKAPCPFHKEKTPSFFVSPTRQSWHCFGGCSEGGDIFSFVMKIEGLDFPEALRMLAGRAGVVIKREDPRIRSERNRLYDLLEEATKYYQKNLVEVPAALMYLKNRGVLDQTVAGFRIGFSFDAWDGLLKHLKTFGYREEEIEKAGLAIAADSNQQSGGSRYYDRFRSRIMFPIHDGTGRVIGFGGRVFEPQAGSGKRESMPAKYINTPQTSVYDKSRVLYAFDKAKNSIREKNSCVILEGYMDAVMSHQAGVTNAVAVSGTALTADQLKMIRRLADTIVSSFDRDQAGEAATKRSLDLAAGFDFERKAAMLPQGIKDPADAVLRDKEIWRSAVEGALPIAQFYFEEALRKHNPETAVGVKSIAAEVVPEFRNIANEIEKAHWVGKLALALRVSEESIWRELAKGNAGLGSAAFHANNESSAPFAKTRREQLEELSLGVLGAWSELLPEYSDLGGRFRNETHRSIFRALAAKEQASLPQEMASHLDHLMFRAELFLEPADEKQLAARSLLREFLHESLRADQEELLREITAAERRGDERAMEGHMKAYQRVCDELQCLLAQ